MISVWAFFFLRRKPSQEAVQGGREPLQFVVLLADSENDPVVLLVVFGALGQTRERLEIQLEHAVDAEKRQGGGIEKDVEK
jgi:hypothetical protein